MPDSTTAVFVLRRNAVAIGQTLSDLLPADLLLAYEQDHKPEEYFATKFRSYDRWVLIMALGIAVRFLSRLPQDKHADPAVVVLDEGCHHAISALSGHEGGANDLAVTVANAVCATPVITTATEALKPLVLGIGCRKGVSAQSIREAVLLALEQRDLEQVRQVVTIDAKAQEAGLLEFCESHRLPLRVLRREDVSARAWVTNPSEWVRTTIGVDGVCEPCALIATPRGKLTVPKFKHNGVTVAVVEDETRLKL